MEARTLVALIDADGCIYNSIFRFLLLDLIEKFGDFIWTYARKSALTEEDNDIINLKFDQIVTYLNEKTVFNHDQDTVHIQGFSETEFNRLEEAALRRGGFQSDDLEERDDFLSGTINIFQAYIKKLGKEDFLTTFIFIANKPFFYETSSFCRAEDIKKLILISGSSRQSQEIDEFNSEANGTGLFSLDLTKIEKIFSTMLAQFHIKCQKDAFLLDQVYGAAPFFDHTKLSLLYAILNRIAGQNKHHKTTIVFRDDRTDINEGLKKIFAAHRDLIPKNIKLVFWPYDGNQSQDSKIENKANKSITIEGTGPIDKNYFENVRKIAKLWNPNLHGDVTKSVDDLLTRDVLSSFIRERVLEKQSLYTSLRNTGLAVFKHLPPIRTHANKLEHAKENRLKCIII